MDIDIRAYLHVLRKRAWYVVAAVVVALVAGGFMTATTPPTYVASTTMFVGQRQVTADEVFDSVQLGRLTDQLLKSYTQIITSRSMAERAVAHGGLDLTPGQVKGSVFAGTVSDTRVINIGAVSSDPTTAARVANAVADVFVAEIGSIDSTDAEGAEPAVRVSIVDRAIPPGSPVAPNPVRNMTLALALGLVGGVGLAFLVNHLDVSVKSREELESAGVPVVGVIPTLDTHGAEVYLERDPQVIGGEAFRKLRTSISFLGVDDKIQVVLMTSPFSQEGKTTCSLNLAAAYAQGGLRTLLLEADLRRPTLHHLFGQKGMRGLTTAIIGQSTLGESIRNTEVPNLSVLLAGAIPPNPVELLDSNQMSELLDRLRARFDMVVIDSPPIVPVADPAALATRVDGVIVVARSGSTNRKRLDEAVQTVERSGGRLLGVLLNGLSAKDAPYEYQYYYSYRPREPGRKTPTRG